MEFIDTQIVLYKFKNRRELFDGDINGKYISSIVALEFLGIMEKNENKPKIFLTPLKGRHTFLAINHPNSNSVFWKLNSDKLVIDFNGEFESIVIYSNKTISHLINTKDVNILPSFLKKHFPKKDYKKFNEKVKFLKDNNITVVPITQKIISRMQCIYEDIKNEYNVKDNYRNSFMDLLILATAIENKKTLISKDKELNKVLKKTCKYLNFSTYTEGISNIDYCNNIEEKNVENTNKGYINNSWKIIEEKRRNNVFNG